MIEQVKGTRNIANGDSAKFLHVKNTFYTVKLNNLECIHLN